MDEVGIWASAIGGTTTGKPDAEGLAKDGGEAKVTELVDTSGVKGGLAFFQVFGLWSQNPC